LSALANRVLRGFSLVVTDRRWAAPLSAMALGFGLFVGVAIGPSAAGTLAGTAQIVEVPAPAEGGADIEAETGGSSGGTGAPLGEEAGGGGGASEAPLEVSPLAAEPVAPALEPEPAPKPAPPAPDVPEAEDEEATELKGVVVAANPAAGSYALAIAGGELVPIHARKLPPAGARLALLARRLANGTFAEAKRPERIGKVAQANFRGVATYVNPDPAAPAYTVSGRGASLLVHVAPDPSGVAPQLPVVGARVTVTAAIGDRLEQRSIEVEEGEPSTYLDLAGIVQAVLPDTAQLVLSADGIDEGETDLTLAVPPAIKLTAIEPGDSYLATATIGPDGSLTLAGLASDEHTKGADDPTLALGDLKRR
jgi:hypothetical protein